MTTKLDELKALMTFHQENPDLNYRRYIFKEELYDNASALIAAVEALNKSREDINWILNNRQFLNADTFDYIDAALAPFGENDEQKD